MSRHRVLDPLDGCFCCLNLLAKGVEPSGELLLLGFHLPNGCLNLLKAFRVFGLLLITPSFTMCCALLKLGELLLHGGCEFIFDATSNFLEM